MSTEGGVAGFASIATELLWATLAAQPADRKEQINTRSGPGNPEGRKPSRAAGGRAVTKPERALFPWASVIRFGLGRLRLHPEAFWALSLPELVALIGAGDRRNPQPVNALQALMALFPGQGNAESPP
jgi:uncharacterized phage protein (TIGR02216 family)